MLCVHFFKHRFVGQRKRFQNKGALLQLIDITICLAYYNADIRVDELQQEAERIGVSKIIGVTLCLAQRFFKAWQIPVLENALSWDFSAKDIKFMDIITKRALIIEEPIDRLPQDIWTFNEEKRFFRPKNDLQRDKLPLPGSLSRKQKKRTHWRDFFIDYTTRLFNLVTKLFKLMIKPNRLYDEMKLRNWFGSN
jgi:hypothetical protein